MLVVLTRLTVWRDVTVAVVVVRVRKLEVWLMCLVWIVEFGDCEESFIVWVCCI